MSAKTEKRILVASAGSLLGALFFTYGVLVGIWRVWPYSLIRDAREVVSSLREFGAIVPDGLLVRAPAGASRERFTVHDPARVIDGYYVFLGWDEPLSRYSAWLYDETGALAHTWSLDYAAIDSDGPLNGDDDPQGFVVLPDGSVVVAYEDGDVLGRLNACSEPVWTKPGIYHHSIEQAEDGSLWVWRGDGGTPYGHFHYMENLDAGTGKTIREIALVEDIIRKSGPDSVIFGVRPDFEFAKFDRTPEPIGQADIFHPNDIDILHSDLAPSFPMFEAGDLLISIRNVDLVAVVDPDDHRLKWWSHGPWIMQHDPDFTADGKISVYNNNTGRQQRRSEIIKMDPATRQVSNDLFYGGVRFHSNYMGKHQYLPNGNVLIVVPGEGRIIEVTSAGEPVFEFNNVSTAAEDINAHVQNGLWVPADFFPTLPSCNR